MRPADELSAVIERYGILRRSTAIRWNFREYLVRFTLQPFPCNVCPSWLSHFKGADHFCTDLSGVPMALFKTRLRVLRAEREWSQAKLAAAVGVTRQTINSIEKGRFHPNLRLAFRIARAFGKRIPTVSIYDDI
jgi:putative transcriptional regulator